MQLIVIDRPWTDDGSTRGRSRRSSGTALRIIATRSRVYVSLWVRVSVIDDYRRSKRSVLTVLERGSRVKMRRIQMLLLQIESMIHRQLLIPWCVHYVSWVFVPVSCCITAIRSKWSYKICFTRCNLNIYLFLLMSTTIGSELGRYSSEPVHKHGWFLVPHAAMWMCLKTSFVV